MKKNIVLMILIIIGFSSLAYTQNRVEKYTIREENMPLQREIKFVFGKNVPLLSESAKYSLLTGDNVELNTVYDAFQKRDVLWKQFKITVTYKFDRVYVAQIKNIDGVRNIFVQRKTVVEKKSYFPFVYIFLLTFIFFYFLSIKYESFYDKNKRKIIATGNIEKYKNKPINILYAGYSTTFMVLGWISLIALVFQLFCPFVISFVQWLLILVFLILWLCMFHEFGDKYDNWIQNLTKRQQILFGIAQIIYLCVVITL